ncbi:ATP-dependent helicase C-terminal domain-containing protein, partial [Micromonospora sonneratiae]
DAVDRDGRVTPRGRAIAAIGAHPRLARALLDGSDRLGVRRAAEVVALLSDETVTGSGDDLVANWRRLRAETDPGATARWRAEVRRLRSAVETAPPASDRLAPAGGAQPTPVEGPPDDLAAGLLIGLAYPERLAQVRQAGGTSYLMAGGTAADLRPGSALTGSAWLAIAAADRAPGRGHAQIRLAAVIDEATARDAGAPLLHGQQEIAWSGTDVVARELERLGAVILVDRPLARPDQDQVVTALLDGLARTGLSLLTWTAPASSLRARMAFCRHAYGDPWPEVTDEALLADARQWLAPELATARRRADLDRVDVTAALRRLLPWPQAARLDELAPERIEVPSGSQIRVDYSDPQAPVLAVKLQETFGWQTAPRIAEGRVAVLLHLLSPAGRPVAVTRDLQSFWRTGYQQVRAELRGRYPRHPWPEDPTSAVPTRRVQPRRR